MQQAEQISHPMTSGSMGSCAVRHLEALQAAVAAAVVNGDADAPRQLHGDSSLLRRRQSSRVKHCKTCGNAGLIINAQRNS